jgi:TonB family protein
VRCLPILAGVLFAVAAVPASATPTADPAARNARNWDVMLSQYPARAREAREQGPVGFRVALDREGYATECVVISSSGYPALDDETCRLIMTRGEFKGVTDENGRKVNASFEGVVNWRLPGPAPAQTATAPEQPQAAAGPAPVRLASNAAPEKRICRRDLRTGSLAAFERTCMTKAEWERYTENQAVFWRSLQGTKGSSRDIIAPSPWGSR